MPSKALKATRAQRTTRRACVSTRSRPPRPVVSRTRDAAVGRRGPGGRVSGSRRDGDDGVDRGDRRRRGKTAARGPRLAASEPPIGRAGTNPEPERGARAGRTAGPAPPAPARSAAAAWATETLAPDAPSTIRPTKSSGKPPASPVKRLPTAVPANDTISTGLRPKRSDTRPQIGDPISWAKENAATNAPAVAGLAW